jgi:integrase
MASVYKPAGRTKYRITYKGADGRPVTVPGYRDKVASQAKAKELERLAERTAAGLPVAEEDKARRPVAEPAGLYLREMERAGLSQAHRAETKRLLETVWRECGWQCLAQVRADGLLAFLHRLQDAGRGPRTLNSYRDALRTFLEWCVDGRWLAENPVARVKKARARGRKTKPRRAYTVEEFRRMLLNAGPRRDLYEVAGLSGLRRGELDQLERRDCTPHGDRPAWHLRPEITKGRRKDVVPMVPDILPTLRRLWDASAGPTGRLFPAGVPHANVVNADQARAGVVHVDAEGRTVDFHSFRYFFCTLMGRRLPVQKVKALMRHRNIRETADLYTDLGLEDVAEGLWDVPSVLPSDPAETSSTVESAAPLNGPPGEQESRP